jgi:hypothetical protein
MGVGDAWSKVGAIGACRHDLWIAPMLPRMLSVLNTEFTIEVRPYFREICTHTSKIDLHLHYRMLQTRMHNCASVGASDIDFRLAACF